MEPIRVLIADDHTLFRDGLRSLLRSLPDVEVVDEAADGDATINRTLALQPDVVLMDLQMPGTNGIEATRRILHASPHVGVLVLTMFDDDDYVFAAMRAGARGYILKGADQEELVRAIRAVARGEALFGPAIAKRLMAFFAAPGPLSAPHAFPELTDREREILEIIAQGQNNSEIANRLVLSPKTVRNHIFEHLQQAASGRSSPGDRQRPRGRARAARNLRCLA